jgi:hypothetical protein
MEDYLKAFEGEAPVVGSDQCETSLNEYRDLYFAELTRGFKAEKELASTAECIVEQAKNLHIAEVAMKRLVYEKTRKMSRREKKKSMRAFDHAGEMKLKLAVKLCTTDEFGEFFDVLYASGNSSDSKENKVNSTESENKVVSDDEENYCVRKYMIDNGFINTTLYEH